MVTIGYVVLLITSRRLFRPFRFGKVASLPKKASRGFQIRPGIFEPGQCRPLGTLKRNKLRAPKIIVVGHVTPCAPRPGNGKPAHPYASGTRPTFSDAIRTRTQFLF